jgi:hypothetical protein
MDSIYFIPANDEKVHQHFGILPTSLNRNILFIPEEVHKKIMQESFLIYATTREGYEKNISLTYDYIMSWLRAINDRLVENGKSEVLLCVTSQFCENLEQLVRAIDLQARNGRSLPYWFPEAIYFSWYDQESDSGYLYRTCEENGRTKMTVLSQKECEESSIIAN